MTIGDLIKQYLTRNKLSYQQFADKCHTSKAYISMLINGKNPKTGKPIKPTIETYSNIASALGMTIDQLFATIDDAPVTLSPLHLFAADSGVSRGLTLARQDLFDDPDRKALLSFARNGSPEAIRQVNAVIDALKATNPDFYDGDDPA